jgi:eukaryotic-like serine/threonine-protein kinase
MSFGVNQVVGDYECLGIIEKPRSGLTYKVRNRKTGELEALRALSRAETADPDSMERLLREMRVHARLSHDNLVGFHDAFELDGELVMTTDYVEGPTLAQQCAGGPLRIEEASATILQVLRGLEQAHELGIVHRGITADHVVLGRDGTVKLGGFDLAKPASDTNLTKVGAVIGDPRYVSPEQVAGRPPVDARSDLYSVGVVLYFALTGKAPFDGASDFDVLSAHVSLTPAPPSVLNRAIPAELDAVVLKALEKNPDARFANCQEFETALTDAAQRVASEPTAAAPPAHSRSLAPRAILCLAAVAVLAIAGGLWFALR